MKEPRRLFGELKDGTGTPFADSKVILRKLDVREKFVEYKTVTTTKDGHFDLGSVKPGRYRFLPAPNRRFKQPEEVQCRDGRDCAIKLVLQLSPSDQEFGGCPIQ